MVRLAAIAAVCATLVLLGGFYWFTRQGPDLAAACGAGAVAGGDIGGPFELVSETGETVTDADVITGPTLVYFGYTFCPDVCPLDVQRNAQAVFELEERGYDVLPVFISIDPERDTPEDVAIYTDNAHPRMLGLTGSPEQVAAASRAYRTYYKAQPAEDDYYLVDHSTFTYLMLPGNRLAGFFRRDLSPEELADRVACILEAT